MPSYPFECRGCGVTWEAVLRMKEIKRSVCPNCGKNGHRIFTVPRMNVDTKISPFDLDRMTQKTGQMKGNVGNLYDLAAELSDKRGGKNDPIRKKALKDYAKLRRGKEYRDPKEGFEVEFRIKDDPVTVKSGKSGSSKGKKKISK